MLVLVLCGLKYVVFLILQFPGDVLSLYQTLRTLDLSENKLPSIPPALGKFASLKSLNIASNRLGKS